MHRIKTRRVGTLSAKRWRRKEVGVNFSDQPDSVGTSCVPTRFLACEYFGEHRRRAHPADFDALSRKSFKVAAGV